MPVALTPLQLEAIRSLSTPSVANAIETFNIKPRNQGFMGPEIRAIYPDLPNMIGYAVTARIEADLPPLEGHRKAPQDWWEYILSLPAPRVIVMEDLDKPPSIGSFWGEVQANVHKALGCAGVVTDGGVRDLDEVRALGGFQFYARDVIVSHAYVHLVDFGLPVKVGGVAIKPGDLILGDKHGVITIPEEVAKDVVTALRKVEAWEREVIGVCQSPAFTLEKLKAAWGRPRNY